MSVLPLCLRVQSGGLDCFGGPGAPVGFSAEGAGPSRCVRDGWSLLVRVIDMSAVNRRSKCAVRPVDQVKGGTHWLVHGETGQLDPSGGSGFAC